MPNRKLTHKTKTVPPAPLDALVMTNREKILRFDLGGLLMDLQALLGRRVDVVTEKGLRQRIRKRVLKEAVPL